jgi:hypothetical protein
VKQNNRYSAASKKAWDSRKRMQEARAPWAKVQQGKELAALRREARIIHPNGTQKVKAKYKQVAMRTPWQTEMDLKK